MGFQTTAQGSQTNVRKPHLAPPRDAAFPLVFPGTNDGDPSFYTQTLWIPVSRFRLTIYIIANLDEFFGRGKIEPTVRLPPNSLANTLNGHACGANPHRDRALYRQGVQACARHFIPFPVKINGFLCPKQTH